MINNLKEQSNNLDTTLETFFNKYKVVIIGLIIGLILGALLMLLLGFTRQTKLSNGEYVIASTKNSEMTSDELYNLLKKQYASSILVNEIDTTILNDYYKDKQNSIDEKVDAEILSLKQNGDESFIQAINYYFGVNTEKEARVIFDLEIKRQMYIEEYAESLISESDIEKYYNEKVVKDIETSHIIIIPKSESEEDWETAKKEVTDIIKKLDDGEDFATLAKEHGQDGTATNGGSLGRVATTDSMDADFLKAAFALKDGQYSAEPVKSSYGYHVILRSKTYDKKTLKEATEKIKTTLVKEKTEETTFQTEALLDIREKYEFKINDADLNDTYNKTISEE
ncbi:MAG: peptidylprolyl isomerase [Bacilli bacterium]